MSVNLTDADLTDANLTNAPLSSANLTNATFSFGTILFDEQTVAQHGFDAAGLQAKLEGDWGADNANNLTIIPEPTTLLLALLALVAAPLRVRCGYCAPSSKTLPPPSGRVILASGILQVLFAGVHSCVWLRCF